MLRKCGLVLLLAALAAWPETLRVMTFNVRYPAKSDGPNVWENRRDLLVETIRLKDPDIFGTQELFHEQGQYIVEKLPAYAWFGLSRRGNQQDEHMGVFYKRDRLRRVESGDFWLSESPDVPGSMSWDVSLPRMVTWALFEIQGSGRRFYFYNTHFPHRREDEPARLNCARLIAQRIRKLPPRVPFILTGDFNAPAGGEVYTVFEGLVDCWTTAAKRAGPEATFSAFKGSTAGPRIDWIFHRGGLKALEAETVTHNQDGRYPSDHYPVFAVLEFR
jgi:endonuclease/exonuclease/phosphatase family metal-dependent hydrolase